MCALATRRVVCRHINRGKWGQGSGGVACREPKWVKPFLRGRAGIKVKATV